MGMEVKRPAWTGGFFVIWALMAVGAILTHVALSDVVPSLEGLPDRVFDGFMDVLKFNKLTEEIEKVVKTSKDVFAMTGLDGNGCADLTAAGDDAAALAALPCFSKTECDVTDHKAKVTAAFDAGLESIQTVCNDKYFAVGELATVGGLLDNITDQLNDPSIPTKYENPGDCCKIGGGFCVVHDKAVEVQGDIDKVKEEINKFKENDAIETYNDHSSQLKFLNVMPYFLVLAMVCFGGVWFRGGNLLCCKNGHILDCIPLIFCAVLWLLSFIIMVIIAGVGWAVSLWAMEQKIEGVVKGDPKLGDLLDHIQTKFPEFWKYVFDGLVSGLEDLRLAATIFVLVCFLSAIYTCCFCCCKPYADTNENEKGNS